MNTMYMLMCLFASHVDMLMHLFMSHVDALMCLFASHIGAYVYTTTTINDMHTTTQMNKCKAGGPNDASHHLGPSVSLSYSDWLLLFTNYLFFF